MTVKDRTATIIILPRCIRRMLSAIPLFTAVLLAALGAVAEYGGTEQPSSVQQSTPADWKPVEEAIGKSGSMQDGNVFKVSLPRSDLQVTVSGVQLKPALALGSWVAFKKMGTDAMVMGDLVLTEDETGPVMMKLQQGGIEQTALHNHVLNESPRIMYMHISGHGSPVKLAEAIHSALSLSKTPFSAPSGSNSSANIDIDTRQLDEIIGVGGKVNGGVYQFSVARVEKVMQTGMEVPPSMGVATAINFQPTGSARAAITGDFVLIATEVNPVIRALRENGISVTALHSHMLNEDPRLFFMHFWANDEASKLAHGLRAALDKTNSVKARKSAN